jgi:hypothetical protein
MTITTSLTEQHLDVIFMLAPSCCPRDPWTQRHHLIRPQTRVERDLIAWGVVDAKGNLTSRGHEVIAEHQRQWRELGERWAREAEEAEDERLNAALRRRPSHR